MPCPIGFTSRNGVCVAIQTSGATSTLVTDATSADTSTISLTGTSPLSSSFSSTSDLSTADSSLVSGTSTPYYSIGNATSPTAPVSSGSSSTFSGPTGSSLNSSSSGAAPSVSPGEAAGIGTGCALVGALLAGLIVFLLSRRKRRQPGYSQQHFPGNGRAYGGQEKHGMTVTSAPVPNGVVSNIDRLLPQPAEDDAIIGSLSKIRDGIKNHTQNYYHNALVRHDVVDETRLVELANATAMPTSAIRNLLLNPATRVPAIRLFLGHLILSRCTGRTDEQLSFLPSEISNLAAFPAGTGGTKASQAALFSKWKVISGALLQQEYGHPVEENDPRSGSIAAALATAEPVLHPFINPGIDMNARRRNLEGIVKRAAQFAFLLFSQPGSFRFDYTGTRQADSLPVFPALLQTVNDEAEPISPPRVLIEKEVVTGLGV